MEHHPRAGRWLLTYRLLEPFPEMPDIVRTTSGPQRPLSEPIPENPENPDVVTGGPPKKHTQTSGPDLAPITTSRAEFSRLSAGYASWSAVPCRIKYTKRGWICYRGFQVLRSLSRPKASLRGQDLLLICYSDSRSKGIERDRLRSKKTETTGLFRIRAF